VIVRTVLARRLPFAVLLALALIVGTLLGGAIYESVNPGFDRIVWLERNGAAVNGDVAVRRALFSDGRFLALSADGYQAGVLSPEMTGEIFTALRNGAHAWSSSYETKGLVGERVDLELDGKAGARISIANPDMNLALPADLARVLRLLESADRSAARVPFAPSSLRFVAVPTDAATGPIEAVPVGFPLAAAREPNGVVIGGADLALVGSIWRDLDTRLEPALAHRFIEVDGQRLRVSWSLDLDGIGQLTASSTTP
jgi:hypothetical protein